MCFDHLSMTITCTYLDTIMMTTYDVIIGCGCHKVDGSIDITITPMIVVTVLHERIKKVTITEFKK